MSNANISLFYSLLSAVIGDERAAAIMADIHVPSELILGEEGCISRDQFAMALALLLSQDLEQRVPLARKYAEMRLAEGQQILLDHGALRTILFSSGPTGALPAGRLAFDRILAPLGYYPAETYPLPRLRMTGYGYRHRDYSDALPQYFVSELHVDQFDDAFHDAAQRVFGTSKDPLTSDTQNLLDAFARSECVALADAVPALAAIAAAFDRQHDVPFESDYEILRSQSAEAAWIATEGNAFNHATDRVADVHALADHLRSLDWPMKDKVEISGSGRVHQTALRAQMVERPFKDAAGDLFTRHVPGSFYEFITRHIDPATGKLDLAFDSGNATGIFAMTKSV